MDNFNLRIILEDAIDCLNSLEGEHLDLDKYDDIVGELIERARNDIETVLNNI